ncbi:hypothetical protein [Streptomyces sp. CBMA156]|uniref:hypothetical protein n=1 Tax=Streptomyces sp. CBMA156 TaxID=1930280 RepID=UPI001661BE0A|nr:hypothetical protein [Streptomyces sp. CBMA156]MBD0672895.1 hypothetical protein [Streptomyces sp. CBMA156]
MNLRALTRGDAAVAGAAVLLFIASFLPYWTVDCSGSRYCPSSQNAWSTDLFPILPSIYLLGIAAAVLILVQRFQGAAATNRQVLGLRLDQWGIGFAVSALWTSVWALGGGTSSSVVSHGFGAWLGFIALLVLAGAAAAAPVLPALKAPLVTDRPAAVPGQPGQYGYPGQPGHPGAPGQYGYPAQGHDPAFGAQAGYGYPAGQTQPGQPVPAAQPQDAGTPAPQPAAPVAQQQAAPAADFQPFWFAVPAPRQLAPKDNPAGAPVGEVVPGTWYLAVEQRGAALVAQLPDGSQGVLADTTGIQRG